MNWHKLVPLVFLFFSAVCVSAHDGYHPPHMRIWKDTEGLFEIEAAFLVAKDDQVQLWKHDGSKVWIPLSKLSPADQRWVAEKQQAIRLLNQQGGFSESTSVSSAGEVSPLYLILLIVGTVVLVQVLKLLRTCGRCAAITTVLIFGLGLTAWAMANDLQSPANVMQKHFEASKAKLKFRSDAEYLYVESNGLPDHQMMVGIKSWQQQVPIPQNYTGRNAWRIPLFPKLADNPISAKTALYRGAIALAVNGVPIFNALNNRGDDAYLFGELDEYGGHCGRGDDYHYHIAPVHLQKMVGKSQPIAYALDGFPLMGYTDATDKEPSNLDEFNGRMEQDGYKYYSTRKYPYINGGMRGVVTVRGDQVDPQPSANPIRPALTALRGATITGFQRNDETKTNRLEYDLRGKKQYVTYTQQADGSYRFVFTDAGGMEAVETYRSRGESKENRKGPRKDGQRKDGPGKNPPRDNPPGKNDGDQPRLPWLAAHFDELDTNHDGILTLEEVKKEAEKTFTAFDKNSDGKLTKEEYQGRNVNVRSALAGFIKGHTEEFSDDQGIITREGFMKFMVNLYEKADRRRTGKLTKEQASQAGPNRK